MFDVAIVGFGPVGATAANLLGRAGISTAVIDKTDHVFEKPRAIAFDHEVMRVFQNMGLAAEILQHTGAYVPTDFLGSDGRPIARFISKPGPPKLGWQPSYVFNQPQVERLIRDKAATYPSVTFHLNCEVASVAHADDGASVVLSAIGRDDSEQQLQARYVLACDGANSPIRKGLEIPLASLHFDRPFLVVDALVHESALSRLPDVNVQYCNPARPCTYIVGPGAHRRWEIMLLDGEAAEEAGKPETIADLLSGWLAPGEADIWRAATYTFHALYAPALRDRRIFLAGDAGHQTPPFMGQGMAQGIRDVVNLAWKLERVLRGAASPDLLDSYQDERLPHVITTTERAVDLARVVCELDPGAAAERDRAMRAANGDPPRARHRQDLIPPLASGIALPPIPGVSGELAPQPWIRSGDGRRTLLDEVSGTDFRVIARAEFAASIGPQHLQSLRTMGIPLVVLASGAYEPGIEGALHVVEDQGTMADWLRAAGCGAILVRPDHYIYAGLTGWAQLGAVMSQLARELRPARGTKEDLCAQ